MTQPILFVHNHLARFVRIDRDLLRERWPVREWHQRGRAVNLFALARAVLASRLVFAWFASWHSFWPILLARAFGRPSLLVIGGYDIANCPEIGYGSQRGGLKRWVSRRAIFNATALVTFSYASQGEFGRNLGLATTQAPVVHIGVPDSFGALTHAPRQALALTVGNVDRNNLIRKGHLVFVQAAAHCPDVQFVLAGAWKDNAIDQLRTTAPANVRFTGWLSAEDLERYYRQAACYVQASSHEGFGLAVAEAMLAGCLPVVTRVGALPEVVGDRGVYVDEGTPRSVAAGVRAALGQPEQARFRARERILAEFPLARRRAGLHKLVGSILNAYPSQSAL